MAKKQLEFARRAWRDIEAIEAYYLNEAGEAVADRAVDAILAQAEKLATLAVEFRPGIRQGTRECVMTRFPYILVYVSRPGVVSIVRVIHERSEYFNRKRGGKQSPADARHLK